MSAKKLHFSVPTRTVTVPIPGKTQEEWPSFDVRGISLPDLSYLMQKHGATLATLYSKYAKGDINIDDGMADDAVAALVGELPDMFADVIARVSDGALDQSTAGNLPLPVQVDAVMSIGELTFAGEGALEKFLTAAAKMLDGLATVMAKANTPLPSGSGT